MNLGFPNPKMSSLGGWCITLDELYTVLEHHNVTLQGNRSIPQQKLGNVYRRILGNEDFDIPHCMTAPEHAGDELSVEYYVFPVTAGYLETSKVKYTADGLEVDGLREPDAGMLAKLRTLLAVGPEDDISQFAARFTALPLWVTQGDCETILNNLSEALNVARKDVVFRLFHDPWEMEAWARDVRVMEADDMADYGGARDALSQQREGASPEA